MKQFKIYFIEKFAWNNKVFLVEYDEYLSNRVGPIILGVLINILNYYETMS